MVVYLLPHSCVPNSLHERFPSSFVLDLLLTLCLEGFQHLTVRVRLFTGHLSPITQNFSALNWLSFMVGS